MKIVAIIIVLAGLIGFSAEAQNTKRVIQLSGVIISPDSTSGPIPGVHIYVPKAGRGTTSNRTGFFSMPVLVGDSVVISAIGFVRQSMVVPNYHSDFMTIVVEMVEDITYLREVTIMPFPTEEVFKQAVLALNVPFDNGVDPRNMNAELMALMMRTTPMDGAQNYKYYMNQYASSVTERFQPRVNPLLNPFNWARFFRDLKQNRNAK
ncbi:MAG TPA: carboxypeptidase-like regulatory domain-containing protein [Cyclobacteriaceae bacterium]|nr:carboxypeptidase-like regulatory domain-containing protein [Cyclobacteriaceae bacterium]